MASAWIALLLWAAAAGSGLPADGLQSASRQIEETMDRLSARWAVHEFPVFLKTAWMLEDGYQLMKDRLKLKLVSSLSGAAEESFVVSFTGSSVTAGHDSPFNQSFTVLVNHTLRPIFQAAGVPLSVRNNAVGNNPCMPYDLCVRTFAGEDEDVVVWEQAFDCHSNTRGNLFERFIREALLMRSKPLVVFSDSATPNWLVEECANISASPSGLAHDQLLLLKAKADRNEKLIYTKLNKFNEHSWGKNMLDFMGRYRQAGIQTFFHSGYKNVRCKGPYVPDWKGDVLAWHPSLLGHEVRAAHFSYVWLSILRDAIGDLRRELPAGDAQAQRSRLADTLRDMCGQSSREGLPTCRGLAQTAAARPAEGPVGGPQQWSPLLPPPLFDSVNFTDGVQCFTDYEPRAKREMSLRQRIVSGNLFPLDRPGILPFLEGWLSAPFEFIYWPSLANITTRAGYLDSKEILFGNNMSKTVSLSIHVAKVGKLYLCHPHVPDRFVQMPDLFHRRLSVSGVRLYISKAPGGSKLLTKQQPFKFNRDVANELHYFSNSGFNDDRCVQTEEYLQPGGHILTLDPQGIKYTAFSYLLVP